MLGLEEVRARLRALPEGLKGPVGETLEKEVEHLVGAIKEVCPVSVDLEKHPGEIRDSIHSYANPDRELSFRVIANARDDKGEFTPPHLEYGHIAPDGTHVPPHPFFWPVWRALKTGIRRRLSASARKAAKALFPKETS